MVVFAPGGSRRLGMRTLFFHDHVRPRRAPRGDYFFVAGGADFTTVSTTRTDSKNEFSRVVVVDGDEDAGCGFAIAVVITLTPERPVAFPLVVDCSTYAS